MGGGDEAIQELMGVILPLFVLMTLNVSSSALFDFLINVQLSNNMALRSDIIAGSASILSMNDDGVLIDFSWDRTPFAIKVANDYLAFSVIENGTILSAYPNMVQIYGVTPEKGEFYFVEKYASQFSFLNNGTKGMIIE